MVIVFLSQFKSLVSIEYSDADFWSLDLPAETRKPVARFLALSHVFLYQMLFDGSKLLRMFY